MELTRRGWAAVGCLLAFPLGAWLFDAAAGVYMGAIFGGWLLALQVWFVVMLRRVEHDLDVTVASDGRHPLVEDPVTLTLTASLSAPPSFPVDLAVATPVSASSDEPLELTLHDEVAETAADPAADDSEHESSRTRWSRRVELIWAVAGTYEVGPVQVTATSPTGLFRESFERPATVSIAVRTREPGTDHLGESSEQVEAAFGDHSGGRIGSGIEPAELRKYQFGDDVSRIDWNATARLRETYVVNTVSETDRQTVLFFDHRSTMAGNSGGSRPIDYTVHAALAFVDSAADLGDPLACFTVGDEGITGEIWPGMGSRHYRAIAQQVRSSTPTTGRDPRADVDTPSRDATDAVARAAMLAGDDDQFARALSPFLTDVDPYLHRVSDQPLYAAVQTYLGAVRGSVFSVIFTDDSRRAELRETVKFATRGTNSVLAVVTPGMLFDESVIPAERQRRYVEFETYQRSLARVDRADTLQLGPGDRVEAALERHGVDT